MAGLFPIPPTFADPVIEDPATKKSSFNPLWINWFLQCAAYFSGINNQINSTTVTATTVKTGVVQQNGATLTIVDASGNPLLTIANGSALGFYNASPITKPTVTGSKSANAALASLMTALSSLGLVTDSTT